MSGLQSARCVCKPHPHRGDTDGGLGGAEHRCQCPRGCPALHCHHLEANDCAQQVSSRQSLLSCQLIHQQSREAGVGRALWSSKKGKKRNYFQNVDCLIVKNHGPVFSLLNGENEKMECLLVVFVPGAVELVFKALMCRRKKKSCMSYSCRVQTPWCAL